MLLRGGEERGEKGKGRERAETGKGREQEVLPPPFANSWIRPCMFPEMEADVAEELGNFIFVSRTLVFFSIRQFV